MLKKVTLVLGLCALITACSESQDLEQVSSVADAVAPATGPLTIQAPDGVEIAATVHSVGEPTVVLVHGWMCDQTYWETQVPALAEHFGVDTLQDVDAAFDPEEAEAIIGALKQDFIAACDSLVRSMFVEQSGDALMDHVAADMCGGPGNIGTALIQDYINYDLASAMQNAGVPIRCINADKWPTNIEANRKYADYDAVILKGYGHFLMQEAPDELNRALIETVIGMTGGRP